MKIEYDKKADAAYVYLTSRKEHVWKSREIERGVVLDVNKKGKVVGIEILDLSKRYTPKEAFRFSVKHVGALQPTP